MGKFAHPLLLGAASRTLFFIRAYYCHVRFLRSVDMLRDNLWVVIHAVNPLSTYISRLIVIFPFFFFNLKDWALVGVWLFALAPTAITKVCPFVSSCFPPSREAAMWLLVKLAFLEVTTVAVEIKHHSCKHRVSCHIKFKHLFPGNIFGLASRNEITSVPGRAGKLIVSSQLTGVKDCVLPCVIPRVFLVAKL